jgi:pSer/pThr/pTyr-binding forkhead associated (FHA) protein
MGRRDPEKEVYPQINLERFDALKKGVSRRHAVITRRERGLNLTDLDSANGTYLNGQRLIAHQPRILRDGDEVRLGRLVLCIYFRQVD